MKLQVMDESFQGPMAIKEYLKEEIIHFDHEENREVPSNLAVLLFVVLKSYISHIEIIRRNISIKLDSLEKDIVDGKLIFLIQYMEFLSFVY